jgi:hypothetical protein
MTRRVMPGSPTNEAAARLCHRAMMSRGARLNRCAL